MHFSHTRIYSVWFSIRIRCCLFINIRPSFHIPRPRVPHPRVFTYLHPMSLSPSVPESRVRVLRSIPTSPSHFRHSCLKSRYQYTGPYLYSLHRFMTSSIAWFSMASGRDCKNVVYFAGSVTKPYNLVHIYKCRSVKLYKFFFVFWP